MKNVEEIEIVSNYYGIVTMNCALFDHVFKLKGCKFCESNRVNKMKHFEEENKIIKTITILKETYQETIHCSCEALNKKSLKHTGIPHHFCCPACCDCQFDKLEEKVFE